MTVIGYKTLKRLRTAQVADAPPSAMALLIFGALRRFGGEAHRTQVIDYIVACHSDGSSPQELRHAILACFERESGDPDRPGVIFGPRFGPSSHRWKAGDGKAVPGVAALESARR